MTWNKFEVICWMKQKFHRVTLFSTQCSKPKKGLTYSTFMSASIILSNPLKSHLRIPGRKRNSPKYAYKESPVRNKMKKAQLPGWTCRDCEKVANS